MNQECIGRFIAEMRKEQHMTQKQLAEKLQISDKTISKWECGNGMPDLEMITPLCENLQITLNELLSGKRLSENNYSQNAEENIMMLLKEKKDIEGKNRSSGWQKIVFIAVFVLVIVFMFATDYYHFTNILDFVDGVAFLILAVMTFGVLTGAGLLRDFMFAFRCAVLEREAETEEKLNRAVEALQIAGKTLLYTGVLASVFYMVVCIKSLDDPLTLGPTVSVALLSLFYGIAGRLLLMPVQSRMQQKKQQ